MQESEEELVGRAVKGDMEAFHRLVDAHAAYLFGLARVMLNRKADAEDVVQETFLAAMKGLRGFQGRSSLRTWLVTILTRQAALWRRKNAWRRETDIDVVAPEATGATMSGQRASDLRIDLTQVLAKLSPEHREVLMLREYQGMSYEEISAALGVPKGTVESRLFRARQELKSRLSEYA